MNFLNLQIIKYFTHIMNQRFAKALEILHHLNQPGNVVKRDSPNFKILMEHLGNPFESFKSIHITGTNGKGSVAIKTAKTL